MISLKKNISDSVANQKNTKYMGKKNLIETKGVVVQALPNAMFKVEIESGITILCVLCGKMRQNYIKVLEGDQVEVEISPYDLTRGRITKRL